MNIFEQLLEGVFEQQKLTTDTAKVDYLHKLQPTVTEISRSFRNQNVDTDYSNTNTQNAYLLRYFPSYTQLLPTALHDLDGDNIWLPEVSELHSMLFGCGPAPELVGLLQYLHDSDHYCKQIAPQFVDIAATDWQESRKLTAKYVMNPVRHGRIWKKLSNPVIDADIADNDLKSKIDPATCHLAVFQNCFNEISNANQALENIKHIALAMPVGSLVVIIDRSRYGETDRMLQDLKQWAKGIDGVNAVGDLNLDERTYQCYELLSEVPEIILNNFCCRHRDLPPPPKNESHQWFKNYWTYANKVTYVTLTIQRSDDATPQTNVIPADDLDDILF